MGKTSRIKSDLDDVNSLLEIIQILKDVASNHFYNTAKRKERLLEFAIAFTDFFRMVNLAEATSPLVHPKTEMTALLLITSEGGFMAEMTAKIVKAGLAESEQYNTHQFLIIGARGEEKLKAIAPDAKSTCFTNVEEKGLFKTTIEVKEFIVDQVIKGEIGRLYAVYPRAVSISLIKPYVIKLLPSDELVTRQTEIKDTIEKVIVESDLNAIMHYLGDIWLTCRIFEMLEDCVVAGYAAQSQQLEAALEKLKKDKKGLALSFNKAKKSDIDKSLREVFTSSMITSGGKR